MEIPIEIGGVLAEKYSVERVVASGGNGIVVEAKHLGLMERCAIKLLLPAALEMPMAKERFVREAQALARLKSDHIVRVFDVGELTDGTPYMVMEYLDGADLETIVARRGALPVPEAALYVLQVCAALADVHALGIVHRDLKPANVVLTRAADGMPRVKLIDFGVSKVIRDARGLEPMKTMEGTLIGTPLFMSPEQVYGGEVTTSADVWAVGVMLYFLVAGTLPFQERAMVSSLAHILSRPPKPIASHGIAVPPEFEQIILACLEKDANARPGTVAEIAERLAPFAEEGQPLSEHVRRVLVSQPESRPSLAGITPVSKSMETLPAPGFESDRPMATTTPFEVVRPRRPRYALFAGIMGAMALVFGVLFLARLTRVASPDARPAAPVQSPTETPAVPSVIAAETAPTPIVSAAPSITMGPQAAPNPAPPSAAPIVTPRESLPPRARAASPSSVATAEAAPRAIPSAGAPRAPSKNGSGPTGGFDLGSRH